MTGPDLVTIHFDGAFYADRERLMFGLVLMPDGPRLFSFGSGYDNNEAELRTAVEAVKLCIAAGLTSVEIVGDSRNVILQARGEMGCHCPDHVPHLKHLRELEPSLPGIVWKHVRRGRNPAGRELGRRQSRGEVL